MLKPGDKAKDFTLMSDKGELVSLSDFMGKSDIVLYFYPKDNTSGCTKEACSFRDNTDKIKTKDAVVLGISPDSVKSHLNFINKHNLNFTLLSDPKHEAAEIYGAWGEKKMYGKTYFGIIRSTFIIGKNGIIKHVFKKVKVAGHVEQVLNLL
jgi:peroxiredoxin Q/BCP